MKLQDKAYPHLDTKERSRVDLAQSFAARGWGIRGGRCRWVDCTCFLFPLTGLSEAGKLVLG